MLIDGTPFAELAPVSTNSLFVLYMRETVYFSDIPTGTPEDWRG